MEREPKTYEVAYLINSDLPEDEAFGVAGKITGIIQDVHGVVGRIEEPRKRRLAYRIAKFPNAFLGWTTFTIASENLKNLEAKLKQEKQIIRHLIVEAVRRPIITPRPRRTLRSESRPLEGVAAFEPQAPREEDQAKIEELDKQLEEALSRTPSV